jgi:PTS system mannose-specific IIA component
VNGGARHHTCRRYTIGALVIGLVLVSHGGLAQSALDTASEIVGRIDGAVALAIGRHEGLREIADRLRAAVVQVNRGDGVLVLADVFGGTASNVALELADLKIEVVTGFNLPMVLKASALHGRATDLAGFAQQISAYGQRNVLVAGEVLRSRGGQGG